MSGDPVVLEAEVTSLPHRAIARLSATMAGLPGFALIGGLAVIARLGQAHRATNDIDAVSDDQVSLLDVLVADGLEGVGRQRDPRKVGSDAFDVARLLQRFGPDALADELLALGPPDFTERVGDLAQRHLVDDADRMAAAIVRSSVQGVQSVAANQLELLGRAFTQRLRAR